MASETVLDKARRFAANERPANRGGQQNDQKFCVDTSGSGEEELRPLIGGLSGPRGVCELIDLGVADGNAVAAEAADELLTAANPNAARARLPNTRCSALVLRPDKLISCDACSATYFW